MKTAIVYAIVVAFIGFQALQSALATIQSLPL
jgi:hypothetical protein